MAPRLTRRDFLRIAGISGLGMLADWSFFSPHAADLFAADRVAAGPDLEVELEAVLDSVSIRSGRKTDVWRFRGTVLHGDPAQLIDLPGSYLGPTFRVRTGQRVRIHFKNRLPEASIVHWHGLSVPDDMDGHPRLVIPGGQTYHYDFVVTNRAGTYWYHPHPHRRTGFQVYGGMAGLFLVEDEEEMALGLPDGEQELHLIIQDRRFDRANQLVYVSSGHEWMTGLLGDTVLVNGRPDARYSVSRRPHRLRLLNGSNSRIYKLAWNDGSPLTVIGTDGGLLEHPETRPYLFLGPGERLDVWADFGTASLGSERRLVSLSEPGLASTGMGMMGRMRSGSRLPNGAPFDIARFGIDRPGPGSASPPTRLSKHSSLPSPKTASPGGAKQFFLQMAHMTGTINGRTFRMTDVAPEERITRGRTEIWDFINQGGRRGMGMMSMMQMPHPMHIHGIQFTVIDRSGPWNTTGFLDKGYKDTVLVMPGERVRVLFRFEDYAGLYLYHCHNLEHEDQGMMRNLLVEK